MFLQTKRAKQGVQRKTMANDQGSLQFCERRSAKKGENTMSKVPWDRYDELPEDEIR